MWKEFFKHPNARSDASQALTLGTTFAVGMAIFSFAGFKIDQHRGDDSIVFTLLGMFIGLAFGAYETWRVITFLNQQAQDRTRPPQKKDQNHSPGTQP